jgi:LacI family transcriptional regulator
MGKRGAQVLLGRIANRDKEYTAEIVMAPELVVRESTGPARVGDQYLESTAK